MADPTDADHTDGVTTVASEGPGRDAGQARFLAVHHSSIVLDVPWHVAATAHRMDVIAV